MTAKLLNAFKDRNHLDVGRRLARLWLGAIERPDADVLVPAPSSATNFAKRGFVPAVVLAKIVAEGWQLPVLELKLRSGSRDQVGLGRSQRRRNLAGGIQAPTSLRERRVVLVDDIVTSGATMTELARAVTEAGGRVVGFIALAETIQKTATKF